MIKKLLYKYFFKTFYTLKTFNYFFFRKNINNLHLYVGDLKTISKSLKIDYKNPIILDVGAHIGNEAYLLSKFYPSAKIHCFEPVPKVFEKLINRFNSNDKIECHNLFLGHHKIKKKLDMYIDEKSDLVGSYFSKTDVTSTTNSTIQVSSEILDNFLIKKNIDHIYFLRIDVNGFEKYVLEGAEKKLNEKKIDFIYAGYFNIIPKTNSGSLIELTKYLEEKNYRIVSFYNNFFHKGANGGHYSVLFVRNNF